ncbi:unnamed protein product [Prunus brigantina]
MMDEFHASNELLIQGLREISLQLAIEEQVLSQQADGQTLKPNLDSQSQEENSHVVASRPPIPPTPLEESEVSKEYDSEKEMGETTLGSNVQVDRPIESLTLATILGCNSLPPSEEGGRSTTQGGIIIDMIVGEKLDMVRPQLQAVKFIEPQPTTKIGRPSGLGGHEGSAEVMVGSHLGSASHPSISTHHQQNGKIRVENKKGSKLGVKHDVTEVAGGPVLRPNPSTSLELQQLMHVPDFALFSGDGLQSTVEHIGRFKAQCAEIGHREALKLRIFPSTLTGQLSRDIFQRKLSWASTRTLFQMPKSIW